MTGNSQHAFQRASPTPSAINFQSYLASLLDCEPDSRFSFVQLPQKVQGPVSSAALPLMLAHVAVIIDHCVRLLFQNNVDSQHAPVSSGAASYVTTPRRQTHLHLRLGWLTSPRDCEELVACSQTR